MAELQSVSSADGRLVVEFQWRDDRFVQQIRFDGIPVGTSVEGDSESMWPPSAPLQQLSTEMIDGQSMVLGVGGAGRSHWSISVRPCLEDVKAIQFDLACRVKEAPEFLGSTYRIDPPANASPANASPVTVSPVGDAECRQVDGVVITPAETDEPTCQWSFRMTAVS